MFDPRQLWTEPLSITELARLFCLDRRTMRKALAEMGGDAVTLGGKWRVRLGVMPPVYLVESGLLQPTPIDGEFWGMVRGDPDPKWPNPYNADRPC